MLQEHARSNLLYFDNVRHFSVLCKNFYRKVHGTLKTRALTIFHKFIKT